MHMQNINNLNPKRFELGTTLSWPNFFFFFSGRPSFSASFFLPLLTATVQIISSSCDLDLVFFYGEL